MAPIRAYPRSVALRLRAMAMLDEGLKENSSVVVLPRSALESWHASGRHLSAHCGWRSPMLRARASRSDVQIDRDGPQEFLPGQDSKEGLVFP
jgi:hypothetical protein